jgi:hypothetical protein
LPAELVKSFLDLVEPRLAFLEGFLQIGQNVVDQCAVVGSVLVS